MLKPPPKKKRLIAPSETSSGLLSGSYIPGCGAQQSPDQVGALLGRNAVAFVT
jgi:hypothetical protein